MTTEILTEAAEDEIPAQVLTARPGEVVAVPCDVDPRQVIVWRAGTTPAIVGVVLDESAAHLNRGAFAARTSAAGRGNIAGFYDSAREAVAAIAELNPAAAPAPLWRKLTTALAPFLLRVGRRGWTAADATDTP